jgi:leader peptidase (prepilin peptidase) / N-methyltransferase
MTESAVVSGVLFPLGLIVGSFLNVCVYRLPLGQSVVLPGSRCTTCDRGLAWFENVPVLSWLVLGGRCRTCRTPISWMYPAIELVTGALFVATYWTYGLTPLFAVRLGFICALVVLFSIDLIHQILPNVITLPGIVIGLSASVFLPPGWRGSLVGLLVGGVFPFLVAEGYLRVRGREGMGMGDFKMFAMVGAFLGWPLVWITLILSSVLGIVIGGTALAVSRRGLGTRLPFGTFIAAAAVIGTLFDGPVIAAYDAALAAYMNWAGLS